MYLDRLLLPVARNLQAVTAYGSAYDTWLVVISVLIAALAAFVALSISGRIVAASSSGARLAWTIAGAISMGGGIWAMHFIGMLAFSLPCGIRYDPILTAISMVPGAIASGIALVLISQAGRVSIKRLLAGAVLMGAGIGAMHYTGMAAMRPEALLLYDPILVGASVVVAILLAGASLGIRIWVRGWGLPARYANLLSASLMGTAISGMHYTAMQAAIFFPLQSPVVSGISVEPTTFAYLIALLATLIAAITLVGSFAGRQSELAFKMAVEIAQRQKLEHEALEGRSRLQAIFDAVVDAIVTIDEAGHILQWSSGAQRIFGYAPEEVLGKSLTILMPEPHRSAHHRYVGSYLSTGRAKIIGIGRELTALRKDGTEFPIELAVGQVRNGTEVFFTGIMRDITERKRAEQEIIRAREEAEAATRAKSYFLATMSHEIRTPMNGVLGMASLLASTPLGERQKHLVASLSRSGRALLAVINDVLDFSKIEAGQLTLVEMDFDVREVAAEVIDMFGERCASKGLELVYFVAEEVPSRLRGDPVRLRQILINLVGNSLKFTERGEILVEVTVAAGGPGHTVLDFAVKDTGIGIAPEDHARIFESFHQIDNSMTRSRGGTGLGLAISRQLVEMMGGKIMLESELGRGSRFHFSVRCDQLAEPEGADRIVRRIERPLRTLLVDTNALSAHVLSLYLSNWTIDVEQASTVAEAEAALHDSVEADRGFDVVILDLKGLGAPGVGLARQIRSGAKPAELILMIGFDGWLTDDTLDMLHAFATLTKPVRPSVLFDCLASIASGSRENGVAPFFIRAASEGDRHHFAAQVLVVEDNPVNREVATGILENMGCRVITAPNGTHAIQRLAQEQVDLILMDCEMPEMDGFEATKRIRDLENLVQGQPGTETSRQHVPIIALTAHALADIREKCLKSGMDDFLVKPFDERQLGEALGRWLPPRQGGMSSSIAETPPPEVPAAAAAFSAIDGSVIDSVRTFKGKNGRELLKRIVMQFTENAPAVAATIRTATIAGEPETAWRAAHGLKSSAAALGAMRLSRSCAKIETLARETGIESVRDLLDELDAEVAAAVHGLTQLSGDTHAA